MSESGHISIHAENILPIIKRWLYSEKEIFLRELVSNAADAILKLSKLSLIGEVEQEVPEARIDVLIDKEAKTVTIKDTGLGMTAGEIKRYINQVAFSGLQDFMEKYKDKEDSEQVIGHFGLGFYSSFMVAETVEIETLSYQKDAKAVRWVCRGSTEFELESSERQEIGTSIILHIAADSLAMLEESELRQLLNRYCAFIRYPVYLGSEMVNDPTPLWTKSPSELKDDDYLQFFKKLFPGNPNPLFWIHLNVDYPFNLKGVLYFPKLKHELDASQGEVKLYCNQVYVADNTKELIPEFLTLLKGVIDCPDLPLNVSRSYLQSDPTVRKISDHITKKVADKLAGLSNTERDAYVGYWEDIHPFVKFGMLRDEKFFNKLKDHLLYKISAGDFVTLSEYQERFGEKLDEKTVLYASDSKAQGAYLSLLRENDLDAIVADTMIDSHFLPYYEMKSSGAVRFKRVDADISKHLIDEEKSQIIVDAKDQSTSADQVAKLFEEVLKDNKVKVRVERLKSSGLPAMLLVDENDRRMREMAESMGQLAMFEAQLKNENTLVVNEKSPAVQNLMRLRDSVGREEEVRLGVLQLYDIALLQQGPFNGEKMQGFIERTSHLIGYLGQNAGHQVKLEESLNSKGTSPQPPKQQAGAVKRGNSEGDVPEGDVSANQRKQQTANSKSRVAAGTQSGSQTDSASN